MSCCRLRCSVTDVPTYRPIGSKGGRGVAYEKLEYPNQKSEKQTPPIDF